MASPSRPQGYSTAAGAGASPPADGQNVLEALARPAGTLHHATFALALCAIAAAAFLTGAVPTRGHPADMLFFADGAWRVLWGQRPHLDFVSAWGPVTYLLVAAGFKLAGGTVDGVGYAMGLASVVTGLWGYWMLLKRTPAWIAVLGGLLLALLSAAPVSLGYSFELASQAMMYNRYCFALTAMVLAECFPLNDGGPDRGFAEGFSSGAAAGILLFCKASYFVVVVVLIALSWVWRPKLERRRIAGLIAGFAILSLPMVAFLRFNLSAMAADLRLAARARSRPLSPLPVAHIFFANLSQLVILAPLAWAAGFVGRDAGSRLHRLKHVALAFVVFIGGVLILSTNAQPERLPLCEMLALLLAGAILSGRLSYPAPAILALAAVALGLLAYPTANDGIALLDGVKLKHRHPTAQAYVPQVPGFERFVMLDEYANADSPNTGRHIKPYLEDGFALLRRELKPGERVATFDLYNPFSFALRAEPPRGGMIAAVYNLLLTERFHPTADAFFGAADVIMYPKVAVNYKDGAEGLDRIYGADLRRRFTLAAESPGWWLYRRNR